MFMIVDSSAQLARIECSLCIWQQPCVGVGVISHGKMSILRNLPRDSEQRKMEPACEPSLFDSRPPILSVTWNQINLPDFSFFLIRTIPCGQSSI